MMTSDAASERTREGAGLGATIRVSEYLRRGVCAKYSSLRASIRHFLIVARKSGTSSIRPVWLL